ncbi:MAG: hypothetical protein ACFFCS_28585, partial [Candidatus Hodarchaeota archaeon]
MLESSRREVKKVTTTILDDDYEFLKDYNMQVSAALSIGVQAIRKMFSRPGNETQYLENASLKYGLPMIKRMLEENREILEILGESKLAGEESIEEAMEKLQHLFIFHGDSGICIYYHSFTKKKVDPQLVSGFLTSIFTFREPLGTKSNLNRLVYEDLMVLMEDDGGPCKFVLIFQGGPSKLLEFKLPQFSRQFMERYEDV